MQIENVVRIRFTAEDLAALLRGEIRSVKTSDGLTVQFDAEGATKKALKKAQREAGAANGHAPEASTTLATLRGDCPYCESKGILLASHIRQIHKGKPVPFPNGVKCTQCSREFPTEKSMAVHRRNTHKRRG